MEITVQAGQSIFDICLENFGNLDYLLDICKDNNISISDALYTKQKITINNEGLGNQKIKDFFKLNNIKPNNDFVNIQKSVNFAFEDINNFVFEDSNNFIFD